MNNKGSGMLGATLFMEKNPSERFSVEVTKKIRDFFERASNNGTFLEDNPLIDCGITLFQQIKNDIPLNIKSLETIYKWSSEKISGGWGTFKVNLPKEDIVEFQNYLNDIFSSPEKYQSVIGTEIQREKIIRKYYFSEILDQKVFSDKVIFLLYFRDKSSSIKFVEMSFQNDSQVFERETFDLISFDISIWRNYKG